jgi:hypothetical protein
LSRKRKPPSTRKACDKRFITAHDKSAAESLFSLSSATPAVGKSTYELNVAETLINLSKDAVTHPTINTESENTTTEMMEEDQLQGIKEASTATCESQVSYSYKGF